MVTFRNKRACVVGSRTIDAQDKERIKIIGQKLDQLGVEGASGNADGSDIEWDNWIFVQHFLPWNGHQARPNLKKRYHSENGNQYLALDHCPDSMKDRAEKIARLHHPYGHGLRGGALAMHTRNVFQALGVYLDERSFADLTIYTAEESPAGKVKGGTSTAVEISRSNKIPTFNLRIDKDFYALNAILDQALEAQVDVS